VIALEIEEGGGLAQHFLAFDPVHVCFGGEQAILPGMIDLAAG
jgi:hypothetical protein